MMMSIMVIIMIELLLLKLKLLAKLPPKLLSVPRLVVLEPVEHILTLNLAIERKLGSDVLNLGSIGSSDSSPIHLFKDHKLLWGGAPSGG